MHVFGGYLLQMCTHVPSIDFKYNLVIMTESHQINNFQIWSTSSGSLLAEWKRSGEDPGGRFSCMACSFVGKKVVLDCQRSLLIVNILLSVIEAKYSGSLIVSAFYF